MSRTAFIGKCKRCKAVRRLVAATDERQEVLIRGRMPGYDRKGYHHTYTIEGDATRRKHDTKDHGQIGLPCPCGAQTLVCFKRVQGTFNAAIKCNARCHGATGHVCECSCGGQNHGQNH